MRVIQPINTDLPTTESMFIGDQIDRIEKAIQKGTNDSLKYAREVLASVSNNRLQGGNEIWLTKNECLEPNGFASQFENVTLKNDHNSKIIFRIVFGLLLYLQSRPAEELMPKGWVKSVFERTIGRNNLIRLPSEVCEVRSIYQLSDIERKAIKPLLRGIHTELGVHYREGHWRRPPGKGQDPNYPKTVWVRPTIVRSDKLADGGLPGGCTKIA